MAKKSAKNDGLDLMEALVELEKTKGVKREDILDSIKAALISAYKKYYLKSDKSEENHEENVTVEFDKDTHSFEVFIKKTVVEELTDSAHEILLADAYMYDEKAEVGGTVLIKVTPADFNRMTAKHARDAILHAIKTSEKDNVYKYYRAKEHEMITGEVRRIERRTFTDKDGNEVTSNRIIIGLDEKTEVMLPEKECVPGEAERYDIGDRIKVYVVEVKQNDKWPHIIVSRTHKDLIKRLFEQEIVEIQDGTVEIKSISRDAGSRTKVSVVSHNPDVDAVGACVGSNGSRIDAIVAALNGEKIDVIPWDADPVVFIEKALSPSEVTDVKVCLAEKAAKVVVPDDKLSLAIGKKGQNASLAVRLTGFKIDIKSQSQIDEMSEDELDDGFFYIGKGEYVNYNADGTPKTESAASEDEEFTIDDMSEFEEVEIDEADLGDFEEIEIDEEDVIEISEDSEE